MTATGHGPEVRDLNIFTLCIFAGCTHLHGDAIAEVAFPSINRALETVNDRSTVHITVNVERAVTLVARTENLTPIDRKQIITTGQIDCTAVGSN